MPLYNECDMCNMQFIHELFVTLEVNAFAIEPVYAISSVTCLLCEVIYGYAKLIVNRTGKLQVCNYGLEALML